MIDFITTNPPIPEFGSWYLLHSRLRQEQDRVEAILDDMLTSGAFHNELKLCVQYSFDSLPRTWVP
jgi:hypothetical protein